MRALRVVGLGEDGKTVILEDPMRGERFQLPADERLRAAARGDVTRLGQIEIELESQMRPREIQARIRAGESVSQVAEASGLPEDKVERFAYPVLLERSRTADLAQRAHPVREDGPDVQTLGEVCAHAFGLRGQEYSEAVWDSWKNEENKWVVQLRWTAGHSDNHAHWSFHPGAHGGTVTPLDDHAHDLLDPNPSRSLRTVRPVTELARQALAVEAQQRPQPVAVEPVYADPTQAQPYSGQQASGYQAQQGHAQIQHGQDPAPGQAAAHETAAYQAQAQLDRGQGYPDEAHSGEAYSRQDYSGQGHPEQGQAGQGHGGGPGGQAQATHQASAYEGASRQAQDEAPGQPSAPAHQAQQAPGQQGTGSPGAGQPVEPAAAGQAPAAATTTEQAPAQQGSAPDPQPSADQPEPAAVATTKPATKPVQEELVPEPKPDAAKEKPAPRRGKKKNHPVVPAWEDVLLGVRSNRG